MSAIHRCVVFIDLHDQDLLFRRATEEFTKSDGEPPAGAWTVTQAVVECLTSGLAPADCGFDILSTEG